MDSRGAPKVGGGHTLDERANLRINSGTPTLGPAAPSPVPARCHRITVAGLTMISDSFQRADRRESSTQSLRSTLVSRGRLTERFRTPSWWRSARISAAN